MVVFLGFLFFLWVKFSQNNKIYCSANNVESKNNSDNRYYPNDNSDNIMFRISMIFFSHINTDSHSFQKLFLGIIQMFRFFYFLYNHPIICVDKSSEQFYIALMYICCAIYVARYLFFKFSKIITV